ncbi:NitT/TauT family transport system substrate-binding protein [Variovorax sp. HW608]|uniref:ABC transporter substrate-binding protein n=1 Tax=Variovorax sp. HW608 TaxID=1034889 RepID=UPI0008201501|nr:ABC transporter substrate-binding protein [Variovorax sp. HW608]SCK15581.1 NitT/TauT family transport system substrate-binding protein [Variovorax sp. HW608]
MTHSCDPARRRLLKTSLAAGGLAAGGFLSLDALAEGKTRINMQIGWIPSVNQVGEIVAKRLGFYEQEGIEFAIQPGGPNIDGVAIVASGRYEVGQVSSSPSVMLAVSQGLPIKCFAVGAQKHPFTFFSLGKNPVRKPADLVGKKVGLPSTAAILLRALLAKNKIAEKDVTVVTVGSDMAPLLTGQVDVVTGWLTSTTALKTLGPDRVDLTLWDAGVQLYALPYYATTKTIETQPKVLEAFVRATSRGWQHAKANRDQAVDLLVKEYPNLKREDERAAIDVMLEYALGGPAQTQGWGTMDPVVWQSQISTYADLGQFTARTPKVDDVIWLGALKGTADARVKA